MKVEAVKIVVIFKNRRNFIQNTMLFIRIANKKRELSLFNGSLLDELRIKYFE